VDKVVAFKEILLQNPQDAFARYGLAMEYRQRGETDLAMEEFDALQQSHPDYTAGYQMAAQTLIAAGKNQEAAARLQAGVASAQRTRNQHALAEMEGMLDELEQQSR
jgi:predicted Zn-dependent protease